MYEREFQVERVKDLPESAYQKILEATTELKRQEVAAMRAYDEGLQKLRDEYDSRFRSIFIDSQNGAKKLEKYLAFRKKSSESLHAARQKVIPTSQGHKKFDELRQRLVERSKAFIPKLGINEAQIRSLQKDFAKQRKVLFKKTVGAGEVAAEVLRKNAKNATFRPPFDGYMSATGIGYGSSSSATFLPPPFLLPSASPVDGKISCSSTILLVNGSQKDMAHALNYTGMLNWFKMPSSGELIVRSKAEVVSDFYLGNILNEPGYSWIDLDQHIGFYAQVLLPTVSSKHHYRITEWGHGVSQSHTHSWSGSTWSVGEIITMPHVIIPGVFAKDTSVLVEVGFRHMNDLTAIECGVLSNHGSRVRIKEIGLSSTGSID
jgi:hypothetical protein